MTLIVSIFCRHCKLISIPGRLTTKIIRETKKFEDPIGPMSSIQDLFLK